MLSGRLRRRALALLGALLLVILVWPPCCATMPKPLPAVLPPGPWEMVPPSRPHPAAVLPVARLVHQDHGGTRPKQEPDQEPEQGERRTEEPPPGADPGRRSRRVSELHRFMRVLKHSSVEPNERRQTARTTPMASEGATRDGGAGGPVGAGRLHLPVRENSPPRARDYSIEPIDENSSHTRLLRGSFLEGGDGSSARPKFDDTRSGAVPAVVVVSGEHSVASSQPAPVALARGRRSASPAAPAQNAHRHQHKLPAPASGPGNGTGGVWHGRRGGGNGRHQHQQQQQQQQQIRNNDPNLERNERSANLSHISGATRKIQLFIKNRYVQLLPDGTVNGTHDDLSDYTILQRTTVGIGQIKIQAVATCLFLCMDTCGSVYGSKEFSDDCIFNEQMEQHHYNTYSSTQHSNARRTLYLALNKTGQPRKIQIPVNRTLGKLATYTKALTQTVAHDRVEQLVSRLFGPDHVRHGLSQLCEAGQPVAELTAKEMRPRAPCGPAAKGPLAAGAAAGPKKQGGAGQQNAAAAAATGKDEKEGPRQKKKKKRRKCREDETPGEHCFRPGQGGAGGGGAGGGGGTNSGKKRAGQQAPRGGSSISSGSSGSHSSVGSSSAGSNQSAAAAAAAGLTSNGSSSSSSSISNSGSNSSANSLIASISSGGPNRQGLPYAQLTATPNARKPKPGTRKQPAGGGNRNPGSQQQQQQAGGGGSGQASGPLRKPKKPPNGGPATGQQGGSKRNGTAKQPGAGGPARSKLLAASLLPPRASPKPASLTIARTRPAGPPSTPFAVTEPSASASSAETSAARAGAVAATVSNALLQDTSQQSEDAELELDDALQPSAELADELDELDEGSPTASSWHELLPARSVSERRARYRAFSCCSFLSLSSLVVYGATVHLLYL